jgi:ubiquitin-protein ligase
LQTPYEGYGFRLKIVWPENYPYHSPKIKFIDPVWNPFVSEKGDVCMDILEYNYTPALVLRTFILSISSLIAEHKL